MLSVKKPFEGADTPLSPLSPFSPCGPWMPWEPWMPCLPWGRSLPVDPWDPADLWNPSGLAVPPRRSRRHHPYRLSRRVSPAVPAGLRDRRRLAALAPRSLLSLPEDRWVRSLRWPPVVLCRPCRPSPLADPGRLSEAPNSRFWSLPAPVSDALACAPGASVSTEPIFRPVM